jgi:DNA-binding IclR family transcriptional regulator
MERLAEATNESCHLSVVVQDRMLVVARAECAADVKIAVRIGATFELHCRVSGEVALATFDDEACQQYLERQKVPADERRKLTAKLTRIRKAGYEAADSPLIIGAQDVAAPVVAGGAGLLGVLCLSRLGRVGEASRRQELIEQVCAAAAAIAAEFRPAESLPLS